jgi:Lrp/AsnC family transcriptional regulator
VAAKRSSHLTVFVSIETSDHSREWLERFAATVAGMPEVLEFYL